MKSGLEAINLDLANAIYAFSARWPYESPGRITLSGPTYSVLCQRLLAAQHGAGKHFCTLLTGGGVNVEILEEHLREAGGRSAALGVVSL